jgi:hypothetical protein
MPERDCKKPCQTNCHKDTIVDIYSKARARAHELEKCSVDFDVELNVEAKPRCHIRDSHIKKDKKGCAVGAVFNVEIDFDFCAEVNLCKPIQKTSCPVRVDVETKHVTKVRDAHKPCDCSSSSSSSSSCPHGRRD